MGMSANELNCARAPDTTARRSATQTMMDLIGWKGADLNGIKFFAASEKTATPGVNKNPRRIAARRDNFAG
jgi:hypothetical protein